MSQRDTRPIGGVYRLGQVFTSGGMLSTYTAYNRNTNDVVGLYVIECPPTTDVQVVSQLLQSLERRRPIHSQHVLHVYDWGMDGTRAYIATDPPRGMTLRYVLDNENIDLSRGIDFIHQIAQGLKALHERGVVGLDLRPQLITVDSVGVTDRVQLDDVGLRSLLTTLGYVSSQQIDDIAFLDPRYAPPEYINGGFIGPTSDIYQLGLLLFEIVTGRLPFVGRNSAETGVLQSTAEVPRMAQFKHNTPTSIQELVDRALHKNPAARIPDAATFLTMLDALQISRRIVSGESARDTGTPTAPGGRVAGVTGEMPPLEEDITLRATVIGGMSPTPPSANKQAPSSNAQAQNLMETAADTYGYLCYEKDGVEQKRYAITKKDVIVGRVDPKRGMSPDIDLSAIDVKMTVSRQHARIRYEETFFYIEDLKSRNKTRLGALVLVPLKAELLQHGDTVCLGSVCLTFKIPGKPDVPVFKMGDKES
jgi:serine/threonine protein kinase